MVKLHSVEGQIERNQEGLVSEAFKSAWYNRPS
jgi:hypothetical protein